MNVRTNFRVNGTFSDVYLSSLLLIMVLEALSLELTALEINVC